MSVEDMDRFSEPTYRIHIGLRRAVDVLGAGGAAFILAPLIATVRDVHLRWKRTGV